MQIISEWSQASYLLLYPQVIFYQVFIAKILKTEKKNTWKLSWHIFNL